MGLLDFFRKKEQVINVPLPALSPDDLKKILDTQIKRQNAQLKAQLAKKKLKKERKRQEKLAQKQELELVKSIIKQKKIKKLLEQRNTLIFRLCDYKGRPIKSKKLPNFFLRNEKPLGKFAGFVLKDYPDGYSMFFPLIKHGSKFHYFGAGSQNIMDFFKRKINLANQMLGKKVDTNFLINEDLEPQLFFDNPEIVENDEKVRIYHLEDYERNKYEEKIAKYRRHISKLSQELEDYMEREKEYELRINKYKAEITKLKKQVSQWRAEFQSANEQLVNFSGALNKALNSIQDLHLKNLLHEKMNKTLHSSYSQLKSYFEQMTSKPEIELAKDEILTTLQRGLRIVDASKRILEQPKQEAEKPKTAKEGEK